MAEGVKDFERIETERSAGPACVLGEAFRHSTVDEGPPKLGCQTIGVLRVGSWNRLMLVHIDLLGKRINIDANERIVYACDL